MSEISPSPDEIKTALDQIEAESIRRQIEFKPEDFLRFADKVQRLELARNLEGGSTFQHKIKDIEILFSLIPIKDSATIRSEFSQLARSNFFVANDWVKMYSKLDNFFTDMAKREQGGKEERYFWKTCQDKYLEIKRKYHL
jgi:hypothetical protein